MSFVCLIKMWVFSWWLIGIWMRELVDRWSHFAKALTVCFPWLTLLCSTLKSLTPSSAVLIRISIGTSKLWLSAVVLTMATHRTVEPSSSCLKYLHRIPNRNSVILCNSWQVHLGFLLEVCICSGIRYINWNSVLWMTHCFHCFPCGEEFIIKALKLQNNTISCTTVKFCSLSKFTVFGFPRRMQLAIIVTL